jgi:hypothetical protein
MPTRLTPSSSLAFLGLAALCGCETSTVATETVYHPTLIAVSPDEFLGNVTCRPGAPGALQTYVATLFDVGETLLPLEPFPLPSSGPVACTRSVAFSHVFDPHRYRAEIQGYDRSDLVPLGASDTGGSPGIPILVDPVTSERIAPRWTTTCGEMSPTLARSATTRTVTDCKPLVDSGILGPTEVEVRIDSALGSLECGADPGMVEHFEVGLGDGPVQSAACGEAVTLSDVPPGGTLSLPLLAYEAGTTHPRWGSTCQARPGAGAIVTATCAPLTESGALDVEPESALAALGLDCSALGELRLERLAADGQPLAPARYVEASNCDLLARFSDITSGPAAVRATLVAGGVEVGAARCAGDVLPGRSVASTCTAEP